MTPTMLARPTVPPTTPPAIAPALDDFLAVPDVAEPVGLTTEVMDGVAGGVLINEAVGVLLLEMAVGLEEEAVDAGAAERRLNMINEDASERGSPASDSAAATLKVSFVITSRYAQAGIAVAGEIGSGNLRKYMVRICAMNHYHYSLAKRYIRAVR